MLQLFSGHIVAVALLYVVCSGYIPLGRATSYVSVLQNEEVLHHGGYSGPGNYEALGHKGYGQYVHEPHHYPIYPFDYGVKDSHTGDNKIYCEHHDGSHVKGELVSSVKIE